MTDSRTRTGRALAVAVSLALSACASPLSVAPLEPQRAQIKAVSKAPTGFRPHVGATESKALWQAARATLDAGHRYFRIVEQKVEIRKAGGYGFGLVGQEGHLNSGRVGRDPLSELAAIVVLIALDLTIYAITHSDAIAEVLLEIRMGPCDGPPHGEASLHDAAVLIEN